MASLANPSETHGRFDRFRNVELIDDASGSQTVSPTPGHGRSIPVNDV
jgi:hypothetical protein